MEQSPSKSCKFILVTYNDKKTGNRYNDTTFNLRAPFKPNQNGVYQVQINEALFKNNESTLKVGDYMKYTLTFDDDTEAIATLKVKKEWFTYSYDETKLSEALQDYLTGSNDARAEIIKPTDLTFQLTLKRDEGAWRTDTLPQSFDIDINASMTDKTLKSIKLTYSTNYAYLLNNLASNIDIDIDTHSLEVVNPRFNGAYIYVLDTPIQSVVNTYNTNNQGYNVVAMCYNTSGLHNSIQQCVSSMECTTNDLSNLRFRLLNDQCELVDIKEPIYIQITVSN